MKKLIVTAVLASSLLGAAGFAEAGDRDRGYRGGHHGGYAPAKHYRHYPRHHDSYGRHHYGRHHGRHYGRNYGYRSHHRHHDRYKGLKIAAGAVVLGSLIHAINHNHSDRAVYRTRVPVNRIDRDYRIDSDGGCVEVTTNHRGQEVWTYVDPSYCH